MHWYCAQEMHKRSGVHSETNLANFHNSLELLYNEDPRFQQSNTEGPSTMNAHNALRKRQRRREERSRLRRDFSGSIMMTKEPHAKTTPKTTKATKNCKRLSAFEVSEIIVYKNLRNSTEILVFANSHKKKGKTNVAEFIVNRAVNVVHEEY